MSWGRFDDEAREYVIFRADTPWPWINYLGTEDFFSLVSNTGGGYSFYRDARLRRITRYRYNEVPPDQDGRRFYIRDGQRVWSPGQRPGPVRLDRYECRHGMGYTRILGANADIEAEVLFFVPLGADCEVQRLCLRNGGRTRRRLTLFSVTEFCLWNALDDMTNFQRNLSTGEVLARDRVIFHVTEYRERRNHYSFYGVNVAPVGFETDRERFTGRYGGYAMPESVRRGRLEGSQASGWSPVAAFQHELTLEPGEQKSVVFLLGYAENPPESKWEAPEVPDTSRASAMLARFDTDLKVDAAFRALREHWVGLLSAFKVSSGDGRLDRMVNTWNQYQCMITFLMARSASYFESGIGRGIGFRDTSQDLLGCMHQVPSRARQRLFDVASTQRSDGGAWHQYQPLTKRGNAEVGDGFNDDPLWLIFGVSAYLKETGDWDFLHAPVPFDNDASTCAPLFDHLDRAFWRVGCRLGPHGLPLIGHADWNDCLNLNSFSLDPDESFQAAASRDGHKAESVLIAGMFILAGRDFAEICRRTGREQDAAAAAKAVAAMERAVAATAWDGEWFLRAWDDAGGKVGSRECDEGQIFIESNAFCAMAEVGSDAGYPCRALEAVRSRLDTEHGILLVDPPYRRYHVELGEISSYPPGYKENGGIFCHNNPWIVIAECVAAQPDHAFEHYRKICPAYREDLQELHRMEPYVYSQMIAGRAAPRHGEAKNSWLTGTAAWNFVAVSQWILGVRPEFDGLRIRPCLPAHLAPVEVTRVFRGCTYRIRIRRGDGGLREPRVEVDGVPCLSGIVAPRAPGSQLEVVVQI